MNRVREVRGNDAAPQVAAATEHRADGKATIGGLPSATGGPTALPGSEQPGNHADATSPAGLRDGLLMTTTPVGQGGAMPVVDAVWEEKFRKVSVIVTLPVCLL
jgi:hypothetical protein